MKCGAVRVPEPRYRARRGLEVRAQVRDRAGRGLEVRAQVRERLCGHRCSGAVDRVDVAVAAGGKHGAVAGDVGRAPVRRQADVMALVVRVAVECALDVALGHEHETRVGLRVVAPMQRAGGGVEGHDAAVQVRHAHEGARCHCHREALALAQGPHRRVGVAGLWQHLLPHQRTVGQPERPEKALGALGAAGAACVATGVDGSVGPQCRAAVREGLQRARGRHVPEQSTIVQAQPVHATAKVHEDAGVVAREQGRKVPHGQLGPELPEVAAAGGV
mmetsp:Transcript_107255/g.313625  ORF Transcript_107255/g.313625 Transcript_107255/m.313625 type:complete len:275 (-) Transcript_107255:436-1260(-)